MEREKKDEDHKWDGRWKKKGKKSQVPVYFNHFSGQGLHHISTIFRSAPVRRLVARRRPVGLRREELVDRLFQRQELSQKFLHRGQLKRALHSTTAMVAAAAAVSVP